MATTSKHRRPMTLKDSSKNMSSSGSPTTKGINEQIAVSSNIPNKGEGRKDLIIIRKKVIIPKVPVEPVNDNSRDEDSDGKSCLSENDPVFEEEQEREDECFFSSHPYFLKPCTRNLVACDSRWYQENGTVDGKRVTQERYPTESINAYRKGALEWIEKHTTFRTQYVRIVTELVQDYFAFVRSCDSDRIEREQVKLANEVEEQTLFLSTTEVLKDKLHPNGNLCLYLIDVMRKVQDKQTRHFGQIEDNKEQLQDNLVSAVERRRKVIKSYQEYLEYLGESEDRVAVGEVLKVLALFSGEHHKLLNESLCAKDFRCIQAYIRSTCNGIEAQQVMSSLRMFHEIALPFEPDMPAFNLGQFQEQQPAEGTPIYLSSCLGYVLADMLDNATWPPQYPLIDAKNTMLSTRKLSEDNDSVLLSDVEISILLAWISFHKVRLGYDYFDLFTVKDGIKHPWEKTKSNVPEEEQVPLEVYKLARAAYFKPYYTNGMDSRPMFLRAQRTPLPSKSVKTTTEVNTQRQHRIHSASVLPKNTKSSTPTRGVRRPRDPLDAASSSPSSRAKTDHVVPSSPPITNYFKSTAVGTKTPNVTKSGQCQEEQIFVGTTLVVPQEAELTVEEKASNLNVTQEAGVPAAPNVIMSGQCLGEHTSVGATMLVPPEEELRVEEKASNLHATHDVAVSSGESNEPSTP